MLKRLYISNYALIDSLEITFDEGLTIITGETGAGKSIILGALSLILGERADTRVIRNTDRKTLVEATFDIAAYNLKPTFVQADLDYDPNECILRREVNAAGRSRAFVNDTPVTLAFLRELASQLVDIHSQHSNMLLARPAYQLRILDTLAENQDLRSRYAEAYKAYADASEQLQQLRRHIDETAKEEDYIRFQLDQLTAMKLTAGEDAELEAEQNRLANAAELKETLWNVDRLISGSDEAGALECLRQATHQLARISDKLPLCDQLEQRIDAVMIELKDIIGTINTEQFSLVDDPERLEHVEQRLGAIYDLQRKHGADNVDELLRIQADFQSRLNDIDNGAERLEQLQAQAERHHQEAIHLAAELKESRVKAAMHFCDDVLGVARNLGLPNLQFEVTIQDAPLGPTGADAVEFMMSFNRKQRLMPVADTASGGEISRVMLAIKSVVASKMNLPTIIFDEVDTGVSGDIASLMGEQMAAIARSIQVMAITHLPQVAAQAQTHLRVYKTDTEQGSQTRLSRLSPEEHILEVARLLSGRSLDQAAIENAKSLINQSAK